MLSPFQNKMRLLIIYTFLTIFITSLSSSSSQPHHFHKSPSSSSSSLSSNSSSFKQAIELTHPLPTSKLPPPSSNCTLTLFHHSFANTYTTPPFTVLYSPPTNCTAPWNYAVLELSGEVSGNQYDRIAGVWLAGVEILRTSTPEPSEDGTFWHVKKDITRYSSLLRKSNITLSMMLQNLVNDGFTGIYNISLSISFYKNEEEVVNNLGRKLGLGFGDLGSEVYDQPADLIIPVDDVGNEGHWFRIVSESEVGLKRVQIPVNTRKIVLELYASHHGNDEFWYSNPPNEYLVANSLPTSRGNGAFREIFVKIDGMWVGAEVPFPVIFTGGINPLSWDPIVSIGAFDLPSYDFELTPFLGALLDGKSHTIELGVTNAIDFWLVDANLHVWLDQGSAEVQAGLSANEPSKFEVDREYKFKLLDGSFEIESEKKSHLSGWVNSSLGNLTTTITRKLKFNNEIKYQDNGSQKSVEQKVKVKTEVTVVSDTGLEISSTKLKRKYPLKFKTTTVPGLENDTELITTSISNSLKVKSSDGNLKTELENSQESKGSMLVKDHSVLSGTAETSQSLSYKGPSGCFSRSAVAAGGELLSDVPNVCSSVSSIFDRGLEKLLSIGRLAGLVV